MKKIGVVTGTRAEYGLLKPVMEKMIKDNSIELFLIVSGMHLSPEFGLTYRDIEKDGFSIDAKNEMLLSSDTPNSIAKSMGIGIMGYSEIFANTKLDMLILLGDRFEIFAAASAATVHRIPIAHIHGGETTEGAIDEAFRHSITKMSNLHFTTTERHYRRVVQMGEAPERVFNVGALGVENIKKMTLMTKAELEKDINVSLDGINAMVTYHPVTLEENTAERQFKNLLSALSEKKNMKIVFTKANSDTDGRIINLMIDDYVSKNKNNCVAFTSLGQLRYLSTLQFCDVVIGNSSSGIIEVPSFGKPTVNIGERQLGREQSESVINCSYEEKDISKAIDIALEFSKKNIKIKNPYEGENTSDRILLEIKNYLNGNNNIKKSFYDFKGDIK
ncbi:MAG: UDP-N-acetylglucosamine 2-epimerase [Lachnospiraceae bacterium]|nr:UDP-N-acetylglucosamine 2-epimerase [Lachnospiraceae bacterium]